MYRTVTPIMSEQEVAERDRLLKELHELAPKGKEKLDVIEWSPMFCKSGRLQLEPKYEVRRNWLGMKTERAIPREAVTRVRLVLDQPAIYLQTEGMYVMQSTERENVYVPIDLAVFKLPVLSALHHSMTILAQPSR